MSRPRAFFVDTVILGEAVQAIEEVFGFTDRETARDWLEAEISRRLPPCAAITGIRVFRPGDGYDGFCQFTYEVP